MESTTNYQLSQFDGSDIPKWRGTSAPNTNSPVLGTYNGDMKKIDNALTALDAAIDGLDADVLKKVAGSILNSYLANGSVDALKLATDAVTEIKILARAVTRGKIALDAIDSTLIADLAVGDEHIKDDAIKERHLTSAIVKPEHLHATAISTLTSPVGAIVAFAGEDAPAGWLICDGSSVSRATYAGLYAVLGQRYGVVDGASFNLPNMVGRMLIMQNEADVPGAGNPDPLNVLGTTGGEKRHALISGEAPSHEHDIDAHNHADTGHIHAIDPHDHKIQAAADWGSSMTGTTHNYDYVNVSTGTRGTKVNTAGLVAKSAPCGLDDAPATKTSMEQGSSTETSGLANTHQNLPPYFVINYIIKT